MSTNVGFALAACFPPGPSSGKPGRVRTFNTVRRDNRLGSIRSYLGELVRRSDKADIFVLRHQPGKTAIEQLDLRDGVCSSQFGEFGWWLWARSALEWEAWCIGGHCVALIGITWKCNMSSGGGVCVGIMGN
jgi:hypothetical protein